MKNYLVPENILKNMLYIVTRQPYGDVADLVKNIEANVRVSPVVDAEPEASVVETQPDTQAVSNQTEAPQQAN
jgi:hypothetical protein